MAKKNRYVKKPSPCISGSTSYDLETVDEKLGVYGPNICTANLREIRKVANFLLKAADYIEYRRRKI